MKVLIVAESGFGKSTSVAPNKEIGVKGLNPEETFFVDVKGDGLPTRGWKKMYKEVQGNDLTTGNYFSSNDAPAITGLINAINSKKPEIKNIVIDDTQYLMADYYMAKAKTGGFEKFNNIGFFMGKLFDAVKAFKGNVFCMWHPEVGVDEFGKKTYKAKTVGKMIDQYLVVEGRFNITLYGKQSWDSKNKKAVKEFVTNFDGEYPAKSPAGMFNTYIPNDLGYVLEEADKYFEGE